MYTCRLLAVLVFVGVAGVPARAEEKLPILETYQGKVANDKKPELKTHFVATEATWKDAWGKINPKEKLPEIDFTKQFLLVSMQDAADPNRRSTSVVKDDKGVVTIREISTLIGFQSSNETIYRFYKVSRAGVTGVRRFDPVQKKTVVDPLP